FDAGDSNLYRYSNNSTNASDPSGLQRPVAPAGTYVIAGIINYFFGSPKPAPAGGAAAAGGDERKLKPPPGRDETDEKKNAKNYFEWLDGEFFPDDVRARIADKDPDSDTLKERLKAFGTIAGLKPAGALRLGMTRDNYSTRKDVKNVEDQLATELGKKAVK